MPITREELDELSGTTQSTLKPILAMLGATNPVAAGAIFLTDTLFRFVKLGAEIRAEVEKAKAKLDATVRSEGIFRIPIDISLLEPVALSDFAFGVFESSFPKAYDQLKPEINLASDPKHPRHRFAVRVLVRAYELMPDVYEDYVIDSNPLLDDLFGRWLDPGNPDYAGLCREVALFTESTAQSIPRLEELMPRYSRLKLGLMEARLDQETEAALTAVNASISGLVQKAILGDKGMVRAVTSFAVERRVEQIGNHLARLTEEKKALEGVAEAERTPIQVKRLRNLTHRLEDLETQKKRIDEAKG